MKYRKGLTSNTKSRRLLHPSVDTAQTAELTFEATEVDGVFHNSEINPHFQVDQPWQEESDLAVYSADDEDDNEPFCGEFECFSSPSGVSERMENSSTDIDDLSS